LEDHFGSFTVFLGVRETCLSVQQWHTCYDSDAASTSTCALPRALQSTVVVDHIEHKSLSNLGFERLILLNSRRTSLGKVLFSQLSFHN
jgi:hypothetical protein